MLLSHDIVTTSRQLHIWLVEVSLMFNLFHFWLVIMHLSFLFVEIIFNIPWSCSFNFLFYVKVLQEKKQVKIILKE